MRKGVLLGLLLASVVGVLLGLLLASVVLAQEPVHKGKKACAMGAVKSGKDLLARCELEEQNKEVSKQEETPPYDIERIVKESSKIVTVPPEVVTPVYLSATDVNRVVCEEDIKDVVYSQEKGVEVKIRGRNAFIKFLVFEDTASGEKIYAKNPTEFFITCANAVYNIVAIPQPGPSQTVRLLPPKNRDIEKNQELFKGQTLEEKITKLIRLAYNGDLPESFEIKYESFRIDEYQEVTIEKVYTADVVGEGLRIVEWRIVAKMPVRLTERMFLNPKMTKNPVAIALEKHELKEGEKTRLFIIERKGGEDAGGGLNK